MYAKDNRLLVQWRRIFDYIRSRRPGLAWDSWAPLCQDSLLSDCSLPRGNWSNYWLGRAVWWRGIRVLASTITRPDLPKVRGRKSRHLSDCSSRKIANTAHEFLEFRKWDGIFRLALWSSRELYLWLVGSWPPRCGGRGKCHAMEWLLMDCKHFP